MYYLVMETSTDTRALLEALRRRQADLGISNAEMARRLGMSRAQYHRVLAGQRGVTLAFVRSATRAFPDLIGEALSFLR